MAILSGMAEGNENFWSQLSRKNLNGRYLKRENEQDNKVTNKK
jgi:hypothetical protein